MVVNLSFVPWWICGCSRRRGRRGRRTCCPSPCKRQWDRPAKESVINIQSISKHLHPLTCRYACLCKKKSPRIHWCFIGRLSGLSECDSHTARAFISTRHYRSPDMHAVHCRGHKGKRKTLFSAHRTLNKGNMIYKNKLPFCRNYDVSTKQWLVTKTSRQKEECFQELQSRLCVLQEMITSCRRMGPRFFAFLQW